MGLNGESTLRGTTRQTKTCLWGPRQCSKNGALIPLHQVLLWEHGWMLWVFRAEIMHA